MKVIKKDFNSVERTGAHGGSGGRRLFVAEDEVKNFQGMTYGYLPVGNMFAWHNHEGMNEVMFVLKGTGILRDEDGEYDYAPGDFFIFPDGVMHEIINNGNEENEMIFVRVKV